jgi:methionine synthase II (cobalamin-independent)
VVGRELTEAENAAISEAVALQERLGLRFVTDGEFRRRSYHSFFYQQLGEVCSWSSSTRLGGPLLTF